MVTPLLSKLLHALNLLQNLKQAYSMVPLEIQKVDSLFLSLFYLPQLVLPVPRATTGAQPQEFR